MIMAYKVVIFTDLDGTLLDHDTYSFGPALPALDAVESRGIPLVICTSKTRAEIEKYREVLGNSHPFISENGAGIFIPEEYFKRPFHHDNETNGYLVIELGTSHEKLAGVLKSVSEETGIEVKGISEMTVSEVMEITGLNEESAGLASKRDYSEPFLVNGNEEAAKTIQRKITEKGYRHTRGGRFHHILGSNDKGRAVEILSGLYREELGQIRTVSIGDSLNDLPMLKAVEYPVLVQKPDGKYDPQINLGNLIYADGPGPSGWNSAILKLIIKFA
jgi:mannosyl-3-phosphoglycerate phosphatase